MQKRNQLSHDSVFALRQWLLSQAEIVPTITLVEGVRRANEALGFSITSNNLRKLAGRAGMKFACPPRKSRGVLAGKKRKNNGAVTREDLRVVARELLALCGQLGFSPDAALLKYAAVPAQE